MNTANVRLGVDHAPLKISCLTQISAPRVIKSAKITRQIRKIKVKPLFNFDFINLT